MPAAPVVSGQVLAKFQSQRDASPVILVKIAHQACRATAILGFYFDYQSLIERLNVRSGASNRRYIVSLGLILVIILVIFLLGGFSGRFGGYGYGFGHGGVGVIGVILIVIVILMLLGRV
jgi:Protein of unknown function (DUF3309)